MSLHIVFKVLKRTLSVINEGERLLFIVVKGKILIVRLKAQNLRCKKRIFISFTQIKTEYFAVSASEPEYRSPVSSFRASESLSSVNVSKKGNI